MIPERRIGAITRKNFVAALKRHGVDKGPDFSYCTNAIYHGLFGRSAREQLGKLRLSATRNLRDHLEPFKLTAIEVAERLAAEKIEAEGARGVPACREVCALVGSSVGAMLRTV